MDINDDVTPAAPERTSRVGRRVVLGTAAWAVPAISVVSAAPAFAASGDGLTRTTPASPVVAADQQAFNQVFGVTLTRAGAGVGGRDIVFSVAATGGGSTGWLTFPNGTRSQTVTTTAGSGLASTVLGYGLPKPVAGSTYTITATDPSDLSLQVVWTLTYSPVAVPDVMVVRVGTGAAALSNASTDVLIDRFAPDATGATAPASTIVLPTATTTTGGVTSYALTTSGSATSEGLLSRSPNGAYLALGGYGIAPGTASIASSATSVALRVVGRIAAGGVVDTTTSLGTTAFAGNNIRSAAVSSTGDDLWAAGGNTGVVYATRGSSTSTVVYNTLVNLRSTEVYGGVLYFTVGSGTSRGLFSVDSGSPTTAGPATLLIDTGATSSPYEFVFLDRSASVGGQDTVYVADDSAGIRKYCLEGGTWTARGTFLGTGSGGYRGLTGTVDPQGNVTLFATTNTGTVLVRLVDTSAFATAMDTTTTTTSTVRTPAANTALRGVAFTPA